MQPLKNKLSEDKSDINTNFIYKGFKEDTSRL
jgi:hypothetical protein